MAANGVARTERILGELAKVDGAAPDPANLSAKHTKMMANPFRFYRGSAGLFYADLADGVIVLPSGLSEPRTVTRIVGDCHLSNFGLFTEDGSHKDDVIFAPNDFDDACEGLAAWDILRCIVSFHLAADLGRGWLSGQYKDDDDALDGDDPEDLEAASEEDAREAVKAFLKAYRSTSNDIASDPDKRLKVIDKVSKNHVLAKPFKKAKDRAPGGEDFESKSSLADVASWADGRPHLLTSAEEDIDDLDKELHRLPREVEQSVKRAFRPYLDDDILDLAERRGAGTGSLNVKRYYFLVGPWDYAGAGDLALCHIVEAKQQRAAAPLARFPDLSPANRMNAAHLTCDCQRIMQRNPDLVLDEVIFEDVPWLVRSRHHARVGIDPEDVMIAKKKPGKALEQYAESCGQALALAHARGDRRSTRFEEAMDYILDREGDLLAGRAERYAAQVIEDWRLYCAAMQTG